MASESTEEGTVEVSLDPALEEWLDARAREQGVDRETVLLRLLSSYRDAAEGDESAVLEALAADVADSDAVREMVDDAIAAEVEAAVSAEVERAVAETVERAAEDAVAHTLDRVDDDGAEDRLAERIETVRAQFQEKLEDVRERVVQVKREADAKAPADHDHEEFARVNALGERVHDLEESLEAMQADLADLEAAVATDEGVGDGADEDLEATVEELRDRLKTVAWVVSDLREAYESGGDSPSLERLKQSAAAADAARAVCERCGEGVEIGLLTEPTCPHCDATVTTVEPGGRFFGKPRLVAASQLESGEQ